MIESNSLELTDRAQLQAHVDDGADLRGAVIKGVDVAGVFGLRRADLTETLFLGCSFGSAAQRHEIEDRGAYVFPRFRGLPFDPWRRALYTVDELLHGWEQGGYPHSRDYCIYAWFDARRRSGARIPIKDALAQRIHDHAIDDALGDLIAGHRADGGRGVVGIMGGHGVSRTDPAFRRVAHLGWHLGRSGYLVATGGGPGIMEAGNLGAWLSAWPTPARVDTAVEMLSVAPSFDNGTPVTDTAFLDGVSAWIDAARRVCLTLDPSLAAGADRDSPQPTLAVPTWFYGHEPSNLFSTHVAKYFANSIREDGLLAIAHGGVVYAPGSAGTLQEVFMDLTQNHYLTGGVRSPMVFLGRDHWGAWFDMVRRFAEDSGRGYADLLHLTDDPEDAVDFIVRHPPRK